VGYVRRLASTDRPPVTEAPDGPTDLPTTRFGGPLDSGRTVGGARFGLEEIKAIRHAVPGTTVNDVVLAVVGGALRSYLGAIEELPPVSLVAVMPMSSRAKEHDGSAGNRFSLSTLGLGTDIPGAAERLASVHTAASQVKEVVRSTTAQATARVADAVPAGVLGMAGRLLPLIDMSSRMRLVNTGVTNVPGSRVPSYLCGARLAALYGYAVIVPGVGLMHMATSNDGSLTIGFQAGKSMLPDPDRYEQCLRASLDELRLAVLDNDAGTGR
jgi:diacylglycerol O-acyltransferase